MKKHTNKHDLIESVIHNLEKKLKIKVPPIKTCDLIYESGNHICGQIHANLKEIPVDAEFMGGVFFDTCENSFNKPVVILAEKKIDVSSGTEKIVLLSRLDFTFNLIHEIRHVWQKTYHKNTYYNAPNAIGFEVITDVAEVDADAFSITYLCENLKLSENELRENFSEFWLQSSLDGGARIDRISKIAKKSTLKKINKVRESRKNLNFKFLEKVLNNKNNCM